MEESQPRWIVSQFKITRPDTQFLPAFTVLCLAQSMSPGASMKPIIDFLSLRHVWTQRSIEVVWYGYVVATLLHLVWLFNFLYSPNVTVSNGYGFSLIYSTLFALLQLALVRIFLDLALKFLVTPCEEVNAQRS
jgi:hypothetical protein